MSAKSTNLNDINDWIVDVINSCKTIEHCESTRNLIKNYGKKGNPLDVLYLKTLLNRKIIEFQK